MKANRFEKRNIYIILLVLTIVFSIKVNSQNESNKLGLFVRVYNLNGKKIEKGHIVYFNDSVVALRNRKRIKEINFVSIGKVNTKRSTGHYVFISSLVGGALVSIIGAASSKEETKIGDGGWLFGEYEYTSGTSPGTGAAIGAGVGIIGGALTGLGVSVFKNSKTYLIDGDMDKWLIFKEIISDKIE